MPEFSTGANARQIPLQGVYAVIGCDGTGKSRLTADLLTELRTEGPAKRRYLGLVSGETGDKIKKLPFIGVWLEDDLHRKANRALDMEKQLPGTATALIMYMCSLWRALQLWRVVRLSRRGVQVIVDRYPQMEIPGFHYDGPGLTIHRTDNWLVHKLAEREQKLYERMAGYQPAVVIRLNIDLETAYARKADHSLEELRDKIEVMPRLKFNGARICDIDSTIPYPEVLAAALQAIKDANRCLASTLADDVSHRECG